MRRQIYATIFLALLVAIDFACAHDRPAQTAESDPLLYPVRQHGEFGYIDRFGRLTIKPHYKWAGRFSEGRALVRIQSRLYFVDHDGKVLFASPFEDFEITFSDGYAGGLIKGQGFRYIDRDGRFIPGVFVQGGPFAEGLAPVFLPVDDPTKKDGHARTIRCGFIDTAGTIRVPPQFASAGNFSNGLAPVYVGGYLFEGKEPVGGKFGFIDRTGHLVIDAQFDMAGPFSEGLARVELDKLKGYIDTTGHYIIPLQPHFIAGPFKEGVAYFRDALPTGVYGNYYYMNKKGEVVLPPDPKYFAFDFSEGFVQSDFQDKQGLIDKHGQWLIPPRFDHVGPFRGGLAYVDVAGKIGYVDHQGHFVWKPAE